MVGQSVCGVTAGESPCASSGQAETEALVPDLVRRARGGDRPSVRQLVDLVQGRLNAYFLKHVGDPELADELLQETMLHMLQSLPRLREARAFWPWVYRIAANQIRTHYRREGRHAMVWFSTIEPHRLETLLGQAPQADQTCIRREILSRIEAALLRLKELPRQIVHLRCREGLSYRQISDRLGCSEVNARAQFARARRRLQGQLAPQGSCSI